MNDGKLQTLLKVGEDLFSELEQMTLYCLKNLETLSVQEIEHFVEKRQQIIDAIQKFDTDLNHNSENPIRNRENGILEKFRQQQTSLLSRVIKADGLLHAIADFRLTSLKVKLSNISHGRRALYSYREGGGKPRPSVKRMV